MFVILVYDVNKIRDNKIRKICKQYLYPIQNSVFEGTISEASLETLKQKIEKNIVKNVDSICIYKFDSLKYAKKDQIGFMQDLSNII